MIECPRCAKPTPYQKHCAHCGANLKQQEALEQFDNLADRVAQALQAERRRRKRKRVFRLIVLAVVITIAVFVGLHAK